MSHARFLGVPAQSESPGRPLEIDEWSGSTWTNRWWLMVNHSLMINWLGLYNNSGYNTNNSGYIYIYIW